ncbi:CatA-like O-acetyltransferase [Psychroflexus salinarum]|uniref:CatA-like O-acetyltransferase n=1 Tax=Psychroflexus salinarum TaxID=546024 RepID=A0ABW3GQ58_9FLAO
MKIIDIEQWNRKEHYEFFSKMANPTFGIVTEVNCTVAHEHCQNTNISFFSYYLHKSMMAINSVKEFKFRLVENQVVEFETIHAGTTIGREDETFGFAFIPYSLEFEKFDADLRIEIEAVKSTTGLRLNENDMKKDLIRHSTFPWNSFTGLLHPTNHDKQESVPKITFGKFAIRDGKKYLPISIEAHHGLVDGLHFAKYLEKFQKLLDQTS